MYLTHHKSRLLFSVSLPGNYLVYSDEMCNAIICILISGSQEDGKFSVFLTATFYFTI